MALRHRHRRAGERQTVWYLSNGVGKRFFEKLLADFARETGAGRERVVVPILDNAGWHGQPGLAVPDGVRLVVGHQRKLVWAAIWADRDRGRDSARRGRRRGRRARRNAC